MRITCLNKQGVFDLIEHSEYYSTLYHNRRVCKDDKYLLNVEENVYNIPSIPLECDEAIYENQIENIYHITIQNFEENNPRISSLCKLNRNNPQTINVDKINYELERYKRLDNKEKYASNSRSLINEPTQNNKLHSTDQYIFLQANQNNFKQIVQNGNCF
uniref:Uncharacterized protein n=1 Tax=Meloidogyne enterolobii TaxID=390850 RepID=A0A6V7W6K2_MELEN|nr:unnamed protein product [Meloidogyne enterolobii]